MFQHLQAQQRFVHNVYQRHRLMLMIFVINRIHFEMKLLVWKMISNNCKFHNNNSFNNYKDNCNRKPIRHQLHLYTIRVKIFFCFVVFVETRISSLLVPSRDSPRRSTPEKSQSLGNLPVPLSTGRKSRSISTESQDSSSSSEASTESTEIAAVRYESILFTRQPMYVEIEFPAQWFSINGWWMTLIDFSILAIKSTCCSSSSCIIYFGIRSN